MAFTKRLFVSSTVPLAPRIDSSCESISSAIELCDRFCQLITSNEDTIGEFFTRVPFLYRGLSVRVCGLATFVYKIKTCAYTNSSNRCRINCPGLLARALRPFPSSLFLVPVFFLCYSYLFTCQLLASLHNSSM
jgi:hypothetical protein